MGEMRGSVKQRVALREARQHRNRCEGSCGVNPGRHSCFLFVSGGVQSHFALGTLRKASLETPMLADACHTIRTVVTYMDFYKPALQCWSLFLELGMCYCNGLLDFQQSSGEVPARLHHSSGTDPGQFQCSSITTPEVARPPCVPSPDASRVQCGSIALPVLSST